MTTIDELATAAGLRAYDTAKPQDWLDNATEWLAAFPATHESRMTIYDTLRTGVVWSYDDSVWGQPVALTDDARELFARLSEPMQKGGL